ncbi:hypothetical protein GCM10010517_02290 [Streptosporangium fragile]|uniref:OmpR/PhoB-type domain-containing protein n=2 Tax=Streptosporangium fragile TaxID=46186 RepID=A0ABP6I601_9ACTN
MLLAVLVLAEGRPIAPDVLIDRIWGDDAPAEAMASLHSYVSRLRQVLEPGRLPRSPSSFLQLGPAGYSLRVDPDGVDAGRFTALVAQAEKAVTGGDPAGAERAAREALALWRGEPYADLDGREYAAATQARLSEHRNRARELRVTAAMAQARHAEVIGELEALTRDHPMRERFWVLLALALYRSGRQGDALEALRSARRILAEELGIDPGEELRTLELNILNQAPVLRLPAGAALRGAAAGALPGLGPDVDPVLAGGTAVGGRAPRPRRTSPVGRRAEIVAIGRLLDGVLRDGPGFALVTGEPGIGKTRLAEETVALAQERGFLVAVGRCAAIEGSPAFWPWTTVLERLVDTLREVPPRVRADLPGTGTATTADPEGSRFRAYHAAGRVLAAAAAQRPVAVVLDDLHWADPSSLQLLRYLAETFDGAPVALIGTARDQPPRPAALAGVFEAFARRGAVRLALTGLSAADLAALVPSGIGSPEMLRALHDRTGGNPFFVTELVRFAEMGHDLRGPLPLGVRDVVLGRVGRLPGPTADLVGAAAVVGREFDARILAEVAGLELDETLDRLDAAVSAAVIVEDTARPDRFRFVHALVQEALAEALAPVRRARLHARAGRALDAAGGDPAASAHHWLLAAGAGHAGTAWRAGRRPAAYAARMRAYDAATDLLERSLNVAEADPGLEPADRMELLFALADARYGAGDPAGQRAALDQVRRIARETGDRTRWIAAATGYGGRIVRPWEASARYDPDLVAELRELAGLPDLGDADRARVLGCLAVDMYYQPGCPPAERERLSALAVEHARRTGDPELVGRALNCRYIALMHRDTAGPRIAAAEEMVEAGRTTGDDELLAVGLVYLSGALLEAGAAERALAPLDEAAALAERLTVPYLVVVIGWLRLGVAVIRGDRPAAEKIFQAATEQHRVTSMGCVEENTFNGWFMLTLDDAWNGRAANAVLDGLGDYDRPFGDVVREAHALFLLLMGRPDEARRLLGPWSRQPPVLDDFMWAHRVAVRAEIWSRLGDPEACADLYAMALPHADRIAMSGLSLVLWPIGRSLSRLARVIGNPEAAVEHGERALALAETLGADNLVVLTGRETAQALRERDADGDRERAAEVERRADLAAARVAALRAAPLPA